MGGVLGSRYLRFEVSGDGCYQVLDRQTDVSWRSGPYARRFGSAAVKVEDEIRHLSLDKFSLSQKNGEIAMTYRIDEQKGELRLGVRLLADGKTLDFSYEPVGDVNVRNIRLLDDSFWLTDAEEGYVIVPVREGLMIPSNSGRAFTHSFDTFAYEGCHLEMLGIVKNGSAVLLSWHDPYVKAEIRSTINSAATAAEQVLSTSVDLRETARSVKIQFLGRGDYAAIAEAYREVAREKGWLHIWDQKLKKTPEAAKLIGASNFKLWHCLDRRLDYKMNEKSVAVNWTFEEAAQIAEHLKRDLKIDRALFMIGGWIHRGYDNQHPDILPACPECGGDNALAEASKRVGDLGYLFCLHDNYQDIYRDSPSWSEDHVMKNPDDSLVKGGYWAGGQAYLICSKRGLELAQRPQNLPKVKELFNPSAYFNDTTFASGLCECSDSEHPLTRWDDMKHKQALSDYTMSVFGVFGSECGKEWAIPHSHFFEGLGGVSGKYYHALNPGAFGGYVIPFFEMIYRDCTAVWGKYGYSYEQAAGYVLHHVIIGRPLHYHSWEKSLYWKKASKDEPLGWPYDASCFIRADGGWAEGSCLTDRFIKNTHEILSPLHEITAETTVTKHEFLTPDHRVEHVVFGGDVEATVNKAFRTVYADYVHDSEMGGKVLLPPYGFVIESPTFIAFHALSWNGLEYEEPVLFTARSIDGKPLDKSRKARVFHGFGDQRLKLGADIQTVQREATVAI